MRAVLLALALALMATACRSSTEPKPRRVPQEPVCVIVIDNVPRPCPPV